MYHFIYNPIAGKGKAPRFRTVIEEKLKALGVNFCFHETKGEKEAVRIVRELTQHGEKKIVAMGGDGTFNEVLNGMTDPSKVDLGLIPCGSGNDFAVALGIPATPEGSLDVLLNGKPVATDYMECSGVRGLNIIGAGIDTDILQRSYRAKFLKGSLNYFVSFLSSLLHFQNYEFSAEYNGKKSEHSAFIACACNGRRMGGGIEICPTAVMDDGLLDVVVVDKITKAMYLPKLVKVMQGKILEMECTSHELTDHLKVDFKVPTTIQIDGELYDNLPFDVRIIRGGLNVFRKQ